jgi:hypothetical protein
VSGPSKVFRVDTASMWDEVESDIVLHRCPSMCSAIYG